VFPKDNLAFSSKEPHAKTGLILVLADLSIKTPLIQKGNF
jgi:hypothetical protein